MMVARLAGVSAGFPFDQPADGAFAETPLPGEFLRAEMGLTGAPGNGEPLRAAGVLPWAGRSVGWFIDDPAVFIRRGKPPNTGFNG